MVLVSLCRSIFLHNCRFIAATFANSSTFCHHSLYIILHQFIFHHCLNQKQRRTTGQVKIQCHVTLNLNSFFVCRFYVSSLLRNSSVTTEHFDLTDATHMLDGEPWTRISPYIIGIMFGCFLCKLRGKNRLGIFGAFTGKKYKIFKNNRKI